MLGLLVERGEGIGSWWKVKCGSNHRLTGTAAVSLGLESVFIGSILNKNGSVKTDSGWDWGNWGRE